MAFTKFFMNSNTALIILFLATLAALSGFGAYQLVLNSDCAQERSVSYCLTR